MANDQKTPAEYRLFIDDSGTRRPDHQPTQVRRDGLDYFALGGVLAKEEDVAKIHEKLEAFKNGWGITYPLHSTRIRTLRQNFAWLGKLSAQDQQRFHDDLRDFICAQPIHCIAAVIHRPGYNTRYNPVFGENTWLMDKTAYAILIERAARFADENERSLRVFCERAGKAEDDDLLQYHKELKRVGMPFPGPAAQRYAQLGAQDFSRIVLGDPEFKTKELGMLQLADLCLYPLAKAGYDPTYGPYQSLLDASRIIYGDRDDDFRRDFGIKYSCFA